MLQFKELNFDNPLKALGCTAILASVLGYVVLCRTLSTYGIVEPALISTKMVASGLLCLLLFVVPSLAVPLTRYNLAKAGFCFPAEHIATLSSCWDAGRRLVVPLLFELQLTLSGAFALSILLASACVIGVHSSTRVFCFVCALVLLASYSLQLSYLGKRASEGQPTWALGLICIITLSMAVFVCLRLWPRSPYSMTDHIPLSHPVWYAMWNAVFTYLYLRFQETFLGFLTLALLSLHLCYLPIYSGDFYGWIWNAWGGGQEAPIWLSLDKPSGLLNQCVLKGELIYETDNYIYFHLSGSAHQAYQIPRSAISGIYFRKDEHKDGSDPLPGAQLSERACTGALNTAP